MISGLMTLSGAWDKLHRSVLRMMVVSIAFYGMSVEGPVMSIRAVNSLPIGRGTCILGRLWVGYINFGAIYCLVPWL